MKYEDKIFELIKSLPEEFEEAKEIIKTKIVPLMQLFDDRSKEFIIQKIIAKTRASRDTIVELIREALEEEEQFRAEISRAAEWLARDKELFRKRIDVINLLGVTRERKNIGLALAVIDSRLNTAQTLSLKISGPAGSGKTRIIDGCKKLHGENMTYIELSDMTAKSLYGLDELLQNKALIVTEAQALTKNNDLVYALRSLISEKQLKRTKLVQRDGEWEQIVQCTEGPISFLTSTIAEKLEYQLDSRLLTVYSDTSNKQNYKVIKNMLGQCAEEKEAEIDKRILETWKEFHRSLRPYNVDIPYSQHLLLEEDPPTEARRAYDRVVSAICAVTLAHQKQRYVNERGNLVAEIADYTIVYQLFRDLFLEAIDKAKPENDEKLKIIKETGMMKQQDLERQTGLAKSTVSSWVNRCIAKNILVRCDEQAQLFANDRSLKKAQREGRVYLRLAHRTRLPSPYEITNNPQWMEGGAQYEMYNLHLDADSAILTKEKPFGVLSCIPEEDTEDYIDIIPDMESMSQ